MGGRTLSAVRDLVIESALARHVAGLHGDVPPSGQQDWDGDEGVAGGAPEVLDDVVLCPFIHNANLAFGAVD